VVTPGYWNNAEATAAAITDGWFHTGDQGEWDEDNYLKITRRIKDLLVLSTGKNVAPIPMEEQLERSPLVARALVVGNDRKYVSALLFPDLDALRATAREKDLSGIAVEELTRHDAIREIFTGVVEQANQLFSHYEQVKRFELVPYEIEKDPDLITPTLKIKRKAIETRFLDVIEKMYHH
jgi:long-chain acyl-CoA synthetase